MIRTDQGCTEKGSHMSKVRLIDADALKNVIETYRPTPITSDYLQGKNNMIDYCIAEIDDAPTVPTPDFKEGYKQAIIDGKTNFSKPQGYWDKVNHGDYEWPDIAIRCSECLEEVDEESNYCPHCGAEMEFNHEID